VVCADRIHYTGFVSNCRPEITGTTGSISEHTKYSEEIPGTQCIKKLQMTANSLRFKLNCTLHEAVPLYTNGQGLTLAHKYNHSN